MARSTTARTLAYLRERGYEAQVTEHWSQFGGPKRDNGTFVGHRIDLFGFVDVLAVREDRTGVVAVQSTSGTNISSRVRKIQGIPIARKMLLARNRIYVFGWRKLVSGWAPRIIEVLTERKEMDIEVVDKGLATDRQ